MLREVPKQALTCGSEYPLRALIDLQALHTIPAAWSRWREDEERQESDRVHAVLADWEHGGPQKTPAQAEAFAKQYLAERDVEYKREQRSRGQRARRTYTSY